MVHGYFTGFVRPETVGFSECQFDLVVQALDDAAGKCLFSAEIVQENLPMFRQSGGDFFQRPQPRAPDCLTPSVQEFSGPSGG